MGLFQKGRVLAQDGDWLISTSLPNTKEEFLIKAAVRVAGLTLGHDVVVTSDILNAHRETVGRRTNLSIDRAESGREPVLSSAGKVFVEPTHSFDDPLFQVVDFLLVGHQAHEARRFAPYLVADGGPIPEVSLLCLL